jgi:beta-galactosidase
MGEALMPLATTSEVELTSTVPFNPMKVANEIRTEFKQFLFGASVYPELQTDDERRRMLDHLQRARMNVVRVSESSWGNIETAQGHYSFDWLHSFLEELGKRNMMAILGTSSYIPPQWLAAGNPEILVQLHPGVKAHPMARHAPCLNHPLYREAVRQYVSAIAKEFKDHPVVIGWQLGNEEEGSITRICYNPACEKAWTEWLKKTYRTPREFNRRLNLVSWGMKVRSLDEVPQPSEGVEESGKEIAALTLAHRHFRRDTLLNFFAMQAAALREAGVKQWVTTDWNTVWDAVADDPQVSKIMDIAGLNYYQPKDDNLEYWQTLTWHQDMHRAACGRKHFLTTETRFGVTGGTFMADPFPTREQFHMWGLEAAAFGSSGLLYWTGNRWRGGHWPQWGGLFDWSGHPEPDFHWAAELGEFFQKWGKHLLEYPVKAKAVILTDFGQRTALEVYPHIRPSLSLLPQSFDALHRIGIGVDSLNLARAENPENLESYSLVLIPAATALDNPRIPDALKEYTRRGGIVMITPFTAYTDRNGIFRSDGFAANLKELTGVLVRTIRWIGSTPGSRENGLEVEWKGAGMERTSPVGLNGYCELVEANAEAASIATFKSNQPILNGRPAATQKKLGRGSVVKLGFWPEDDSLFRLIRHLVPDSENLLREPLPAGVVAVPRTDNSMFVVNTTSKIQPVQLQRTSKERLSGEHLGGDVKLKAYQVIWLE